MPMASRISRRGRSNSCALTIRRMAARAPAPLLSSAPLTLTAPNLTFQTSKSRRSFAGNFDYFRHNHLACRMFTCVIRGERRGVPPPPLQNLQFSTKVCREFYVECTTNSVRPHSELTKMPLLSALYLAILIVFKRLPLRVCCGSGEELRCLTPSKSLPP